MEPDNIQEAPEAGIDMETAISSEDLGLGSSEASGPVADGEVPHEQSADPVIEAPVVEEPVVEAIPRPQSIAKDKEEVWAKMPRDVQELYLHREQQMLDGIKGYKADADFGRGMKEVFTPYKAFLTAQGLDEVKASQYLMNAHFRMNTASPQDKVAMLANLARSYGVDPTQIPAQNQQQIDPAVRQLNDRIAQLEGSLTQRQQQQLNEARATVTTQVTAFAEKNPYFNDVAEDIVPFINAGHDLQSAYDKAVWANPVTRAKEQARLQTENEKALRAKAKEDAEIARKARGSNVRTRDTNRAPTEPLGTMEDTMRDTLKTLRSQTH
jgi:hypothetical protein